jgi:hypothetical protein
MYQKKRSDTMTDYQRIVKMIDKVKKDNSDLEFHTEDGADGDFPYITLVGCCEENRICLNFDIHGDFKGWE